MNSAYLDELNASQRDAVLYCDGPSLVIAGAGSGKTRVLTYKIAHLLNIGYAPYDILALTFTNKAAREMKERIGRLVGEDRSRYLWMGTFHSVFSRILRAEAEKIGFQRQFTIYDADDSKSLIRSIIKELGLDDKTYKPGAVQNRISNAKNHLVTADRYAASRQILEADKEADMPRIHEVYTRYAERCRQACAMDFDDLLLYTYILFKEHPDVLANYSERFKYVLVDEYQDTNFAQHSIVLQLTENGRHVCVVGDDAQSIYSFRGADIDNVLNFTKVYQDARLFKLEQNYRSTQTIVRAANSLIDKNSRQIRKTVFSENSVGEPLPVWQAYSDVEEADMVVNKIKTLHRAGCGYSGFAILYRTNSQSRRFEDSLRKSGIPYRIYGGLSFYQRKEVKDVISYLRLVVNPSDEEAFKRIINYPARGIGDTTVGKIAQAATDNNVSLWEVISNPLSYALSVNKGTHAKLQAFHDMIEEFISMAGECDAYTVGKAVIFKSGIMTDLMADNSIENLTRRENVDELVNNMSEFCSMRREEGNENVSLIDFLAEVSLQTDQDMKSNDDGESVTLMTVHSAKGLEFKNVFVVGMEEDLFPSSMGGGSPRAIEEERRLFYVAITRAEEHCFISYAKSRMRYGRTEFASPSRFLRDIDTRFLALPAGATIGRSVDSAARAFRSEQQTLQRPSATATAGRTLKRVGSLPPSGGVASSSSSSSSASSAGASQAAVRVGQHIIHERFGRGEVIAVDGAGDNAKATIVFENVGQKQLLLRYARFSVAD